MKDFNNFIAHLKFEAITLAVLMLVLGYINEMSIWWIAILFLAFDVSIIGYTINKKIGSIFYNIGHNYSIPTILIAVGVFYDLPGITMLGVAWTFHIAVDRCFGFGLKHSHSFKQTHMTKNIKQ